MSRVFERNLKGISMKFQICFKGVSRKFKGCSKKVCRVLQGSLNGVSRKSRNIGRCFIGVLCGVQVYTKEVQRVFRESFKVVKGSLKKAFKGVSRMFH